MKPVVVGKVVGLMGMDQYGGVYHNIGPHPRKELVNRIGVKHVSKMYRDTADGGAVHCGYVIGGKWISLYVLATWRGVKSTLPVGTDIGKVE